MIFIWGEHMDTMIQSYMEETEDMLQRAEECVIRLETDFSSEDINELFRIAHTIKGSSHMVGYEDIGNLMHKIEDMLESVRNGSISFNKEIVSLCFDGLDIVKKMLQARTERYSEDFLKEHTEEAAKIAEKIHGLIKVNNTEKNIVSEQENTGIVSTFLNKKPRGKNKYYITVVIEEDAPMVSPVFILILKNIEDIGTILYSTITDDDLWSTDENEVRELEMILSTDLEEAQLYTHFALFYVEKINIINLNRNVNEINDYYLNETDYTPYLTVLNTLMELYRLAFCGPCETEPDNKTGYIIKQLQSETSEALSRLRNKIKSKAYKKEFDELFNLTKKMLNGKTGTNQKIRTKIQERLNKFIEILYHGIKGRYIVGYIKLEKDNPIISLEKFIRMINKSSILIILINISMLDILHENEIKDLIRIRNELQEQGIEIGLIMDRSCSRKIVNIFDSIKQIHEFRLCTSELDAILGMFRASDSFQRITGRIDLLKYGTKGC